MLVLVLAVGALVLLVAVVLLAVLGLRVWRELKGLGREVALAGERVAEATDALAAAEPGAHRTDS